VIRFRYTEDERRYLSLRSEVYRILAANLEPRLVSKAMRNFGKLEQLVYFEGVRQGFAGAELSLLMKNSGHRGLKAFQAHSHVYGSSDTPLRDVEVEHLQSLGLSEDTARGAWLDDAPMRFAPRTLAEWEGEQSENAASDDASFLERIASLKDTDPDAVPFVEGDIPGLPAFLSERTASVVEPFERSEPEPPAEAETPVESPQFLDRVRDFLLQAPEKYGSWNDMIFKLHLGMQVDAGYLDIVLSTPEGLTVLAQCNQTHLHPGAEMNLTEIQKRES
jgi:hypothetical protein